MEEPSDILAGVGVVAIGRNEGPRLVRCLRSLLAAGADPARTVYVDSGSADGSPAAARVLGVRVVESDPATPFTAARARNAGLGHLLAARPDLRLVQFVDGDCEVDPAWLRRAAEDLSARPAAAAVCGRRRERFPDHSPYNRLCDLEWDTPLGDAASFGGDVMIRADLLRQVGGYNADIIAAEDTELGVRLRKAGWKTLRIAAEMTLHDVALSRFGQWRRRMVRAGHGFAEIAALHGKPPTRFWAREARSNWFWGLILPMVALGAAVPTRGLSLLLLGGYVVLWARMRRSARRRGLSPRDAALSARFGTLAKFPLMAGQAKYRLGRLAGRRSRIIEYKGPAAVTPVPSPGTPGEG